MRKQEIASARRSGRVRAITVNSPATGGVGDIALGSVQNIAIVLRTRAGGERHGIGASVRFSQREGTDQLPTGQPQQIMVLLPGRPGEQDGLVLGRSLKRNPPAVW